MDEIEYESIIQWYCQNQYYNDMLSYARQATEAYSSNERLRILLVLSFTFNGLYKDGLKEASSLVNIQDYPVAFLSALVTQSYINKNHISTDRITATQIDTMIREYYMKASFSALSLATITLLLLKKFDEAKVYSDRAYTLNSSDIFVLLAKGWCSLNQDNLTENTG